MAQLDNAYALIIGVDENSIADWALPTVTRDVHALHNVLIDEQLCGYQQDNVKLITGTASTRNTILEAFYWLEDKIGPQQDATVVIYYSGHGHYDIYSNQFYLLPYDVENERDLSSRAISAPTFAKHIEALQVDRLFVVFDCCHADGMQAKGFESLSRSTLHSQPFPIEDQFGSLRNFTGISKGLESLSSGRGRTMLNSCQSNEKSYARSDGKMSIFTYHLIEALTGHATFDPNATEVLVTDVMSHLARYVPESAIAQFNRSQTPVLKTTGTYSIALMIGGNGTKSIDTLPDPLNPATGKINIDRSSLINTGGGDYVGGNYINGDYIGRDKVNNGDIVYDDKFGGDNVLRSKITGSQATGTNSGDTIDRAQLLNLFAPLIAQVVMVDLQAVQNVLALQENVADAQSHDDEQTAELIESIADAVPSVIHSIVDLFNHPHIVKLTGPVTRYVVRRLGKR